MKNKILALFIAVSLMLTLTSCEILTGFVGGDGITDDDPFTEPEGGADNECGHEPEHVHEWGDATCTEPGTCLCGETVGEPLGHNMSEASCLEYARCQNEGCDEVGDTLASHRLVHVYSEGVSSFVCAVCDKSFALDTGYYLDGTHYSGMVGVANRDKYTTKEGTHLPVITEHAEYQLINITGMQEQMQLWVPSNNSVLDDFRAENSSVGFFAFRVNASINENSGMKFVDTSATAERWSDEWCIQEQFFSLSNLYFEDGEIMINVRGFNHTVLKSLKVVENDDGFSGWINVIIGIELDAESDSITLHYYIGGEYCGTMSKSLTTNTNGINSIYVNFHTSREGMGAYFDDIVFGYTNDAEWIFD